MPGHAAIGIHNNLTPGQTAVALRPADDKTAGGVDKIFCVFIQQFCRHNFLNNQFDHILLDLVMCGIRIVLGGNNNRIHTDRLSVFVFHRNLGLSVRTEISQSFILADFGKSPGQFVSQGDRQRHQFRCFVTGVTEHHALVAGAHFVFRGSAFLCFLGFIHAHGNIAGLFVNGDQHAAGGTVKTIFCPVVTNAQDCVPCDFGNIHKTGGGYLAYDVDLAGSHYRFAGHPAFRVLFQNCVQDGVRNLVGNFIRMTFRNRFRGK